MTHLIPKYHYNEEGEKINSEFNNRMYAKKAFKAYLKGKQHFMYKNAIYTVPTINKQNLNNYLDSVSVEELENFNIEDIINIEDKEENGSKN